jgi:predicted RNA-binding Zn-ribbon protein involved in translation (DUF1610 family)
VSDFWSRKLGVQQQPAAQPQQSAPASSRPWWDQSAVVMPQGPHIQQPAAQGFSPEHDFSKAKSARMDDRCPECGSNNYAPIATAKTRRGAMETWRCFDCGYPVVQEFSGMASVGQGQAEGRSRQLDHGGLHSNYQPTNTVAGALRSQSDLR